MQTCGGSKGAPKKNIAADQVQGTSVPPPSFTVRVNFGAIRIFLYSGRQAKKEKCISVLTIKVREYSAVSLRDVGAGTKIDQLDFREFC